MKIIKKLLDLSFVLTITLGLTGCFDLGSFGEERESVNHNIKEHDYDEYYKAYYDSVDTIYLYSQDKSSNEYDLKEDFFNRETVNDMKVTAPENEYILMAFELKKALSIEALSMYVKANESVMEEVKLDVYLYVMTTTYFTNLCAYDDEDLVKKDADGEYVYDLDGNVVFKTFDIPECKKAVGSASTNISGNSWSSFTINRFNDKKSLEAKIGDVLVVCFYNNTGYQRIINEETKDASLKRKKVSFELTNLLIRAN